MAVSYTNILPHVLKWEGGLVYIPSEGQYTNKGVQYSTYRQLCLKVLGNQPSWQQFKNLTDDQVGKFVQYFWNIATYNNAIKSQQAANLMFQAYWGSGAGGIKQMQQALNQAAKTNLVVDGVVGPLTAAAINTTKNAAAILYDALKSYYNYLGSKSQYKQFLDGWLNRLAELLPGKTPSQKTTSGSVLVAAIVTTLILARQ